MLAKGTAPVYHTLFRTITNSSYQRGTLDGQLWISMYEYYDGYILLLMRCGDYRMHARCVIMTKDIRLFTSFNKDIFNLIVSYVTILIVKLTRFK